jgi:hypothetical protein
LCGNIQAGHVGVMEFIKSFREGNYKRWASWKQRESFSFPDVLKLRLTYGKGRTW